MVESRQADEPETYLYDNDNDRADLFYSAGTATLSEVCTECTLGGCGCENVFSFSVCVQME